MGAAERHHGRLLATLIIVTGALDLASGTGTWFLDLRVISTTLLCATVAGALAYALNRRGAWHPALAVLVGSQLLVPPILTLGTPHVGEVEVLTLAVWFTPGLLIASAFVSHRRVLWLGAVSAGLFVGTLSLHGGFRHVAVFEACVFIVTLAGLVAVATRHRDALDAIHQAELRGRNEELQHFRDSLEDQVAERTKALLGAEKMAAIGRLTAGIAHELSSPLAAVLGSHGDLEHLIAEYEQSIGDASVEPEDHRAIAREMAEALDTAHKASRRSVSFVRSIKAQTRVSVAGKAEQFDAAVLVRDCAHLLSHVARAANCRVHVRSAGPILLTALPNRLSQAVTNLLQNAVDATGERGGGEVVAEVTGNDPTGVVVRVSDQGGGIADDVLPRIFEPLFTTKPYGRGTGLGLAIVKEAVEEDLHGQVRVQTSMGHGTTFEIVLPPARKGSDRAA